MASSFPHPPPPSRPSFSPSNSITMLLSYYFGPLQQIFKELLQVGKFLSIYLTICSPSSFSVTLYFSSWPSFSSSFAISQVIAYKKLYWSPKAFLSSFFCQSTFQAGKKVCYREAASQGKRRHWKYAVKHRQRILILLSMGIEIYKEVSYFYMYVILNSLLLTIKD